MSPAVGVASPLVPPKTHFRPKSYNPGTNPLPLFLQFPRKLHSQVSFTTSFSSFHRSTKSRPSNPSKASVGNIEYEVEPQTSVKFEKDLAVPGCSSSLTLLGTGYREKVFAIISVKVYAAGFYVNVLLNEKLFSWKGRPQAELLGDSSLFKSILQEPMEKSLKISLVRDVDGDTFWNALNDVISPRIKEPTAADQSALSTFRSTFQGRPLKKGTVIILTWSEPSKMLVSISSNGIPSATDSIIESTNVTTSLFDAFFGESPVSPTLKESVANGLVAALNRT